MTGKNLEQRAQAAAHEIMLHCSMRQTGPNQFSVEEIIAKHFADVGGNEKLRSALRQIHSAACAANVDNPIKVKWLREIAREALAQPADAGADGHGKE